MTSGMVFQVKADIKDLQDKMAKAAKVVEDNAKKAEKAIVDAAKKSTKATEDAAKATKKITTMKAVICQLDNEPMHNLLHMNPHIARKLLFLILVYV